MRYVALSGLVRTTPVPKGEAGHLIEVPLSGGGAFHLDGGDFRELVSDDRQTMTFDRALLFLRAGRRVVRGSWNQEILGNLQLVGETLHWSLDDSMTVILPGEDLLANDWIVLP